MNKKELSEIKKQFTPEENVITRICDCYVDGDKNIIFQSKRAFHSLSEEDTFKYIEIFKKAMSGTFGRQLLNMEFPLKSEEAGGTQEFLLRLRNSKLENDDLIQEFYSKVIEKYIFDGNYYILLIHFTYDIPGKSSDGLDLFDASDEVYEGLLFSVCPVKLEKAGLAYEPKENAIVDRNRDWIVDMPMNGFLFPAFNDRSCDIHSTLYYSKKPESIQPLFIDDVLGTTTPLTAETQKETFDTLITETLGEDCDLETVINIHDTINEMVENHNEQKPDEPLTLTKRDVQRVLEESGVDQEKLTTFDRHFEEIADTNTELVATNIVNTKKLSIETPDIVIKVNPERSDLVETKIIDGRKCLIITVDDRVEINGIDVKTV